MAQVHAPHVVVLTSPGVGHVAPVAELATRLAALHGVTSTIVTYTNLSSPASSPALASLPPGISTAALPEVPLDDLPGGAHIVTRIITVVQRTLPHLRALLCSLLGSTAGGVMAFLADMLCPAALAVARELGVPHYVFYTSSLMSLATLLYNTELARTTTCECRDLPGPIVLPGCLPLHGADLVDPVQERTDPVYGLLVDMGLDYLHSDGYIVNTFDSLEHETLEAFKELSDKGVYAPAYAVGPFVRSSSDEAAKHRCMPWLDEQPDGSVLYVCFGSADRRAGGRAGGERPEVPVGRAVPQRQGQQREVLWWEDDRPRRRRRPAELPAGGVRRDDQARGARRTGVGAAGGDPGPPRRRRVPDALRVELGAGDHGRGRAGAGVAAVRRAADERCEAGVGARRAGAAGERPAGGRAGVAGRGGRGGQGADGGGEGRRGAGESARAAGGGAQGVGARRACTPGARGRRRHVEMCRCESGGCRCSWWWTVNL
ncbi:hypothetical protein C2845_PM04G15210 [Panicum miliaceum]|uniref:Anthocyanidin 5,3-O-glucosyltransferase-like n=1 Tax=Panicum miliaceum TaxID=4540 RepID=A0A3L6QWX9_PANMI|nr:hypothetical protein C2845_PM04G15210 [Panicum miliaceum]